MQYYNFSPVLTKAYPIIKDALIVTHNFDPSAIQEVITQELLPEASSMLGTNVKLILVTVMDSHYIAHWDLIFRVNPNTKDLALCHDIFENSIELDDSCDHFEARASDIYKISFKVC